MFKHCISVQRKIYSLRNEHTQVFLRFHLCGYVCTVMSLRLCDVQHPSFILVSSNRSSFHSLVSSFLHHRVPSRPDWKASSATSCPMPPFPLGIQQDQWSLVRCQVSSCHHQTFLGAVILSSLARLSDVPPGDSLIEGIVPTDFAFSQLGTLTF